VSKGERWYRLTIRVLELAEKLPWGEWARNARERRVARRERRKRARELRRESR